MCGVSMVTIFPRRTSPCGRKRPLPFKASCPCVPNCYPSPRGFVRLLGRDNGIQLTYSGVERDSRVAAVCYWFVRRSRDETRGWEEGTLWRGGGRPASYRLMMACVRSYVGVRCQKTLFPDPTRSLKETNNGAVLFFPFR